MKIGILTHYYRSLNYGGMLQAYALAMYLRRNGFDAEQISYAFSSEPFLKASRPVARVPLPKPRARFIRRVWDSLRYRLYEKPRLAFYEDYRRNLIPLRAESFAAFQNLVPHSDLAFDSNTIVSAVDHYDCLITGSDQVWNFDWFNPAFFLDFPDCRAQRLAYAASAGRSEFPEEEAAYLRQTLSHFDTISVREADLAESLNRLLKTNMIETAVDPTLLLSAGEWSALASSRLVKKPYLFCYFLHNDIKLVKLAQAFAWNKRLKIVTIPFPGIEYNDADIRFGTHRMDAAGPKDFLSLVLHADYVLTDSFHASVFSLIFNKPFFAFPRSDATGMSSRLKTLTELFGCPERFCTVPAAERLDYILSRCKHFFIPDQERALLEIHSSKEFLLQAIRKD